MPNIAIDALFKGEILVFRAPRGVLKIKGPDALDFLQRMSTNDLSPLIEPFLMQTSFVNNKGRMIDHAWIMARDKDNFIIVSSHDQSEILKDWLEQFHFVEDFIIEDLSETHDCYFLFAKSDLAAPLGGHKIWDANLYNLPIDVYLSLLPANINAYLIDKSVFHTLSIACLMPGINEINDKNMPQNINLTNFIGINKGCYLGQEVIAKAITYQKRVKTLCGVYLAEKTFALAKIGMEVLSPLNEIGVISSIAPHFVDGFVNALVMSDFLLTSRSFSKETIIATGPFIERNPNNLR